MTPSGRPRPAFADSCGDHDLGPASTQYRAVAAEERPLAERSTGRRAGPTGPVPRSPDVAEHQSGRARRALVSPVDREVHRYPSDRCHRPCRPRPGAGRMQSQGAVAGELLVLLRHRLPWPERLAGQSHHVTRARYPSTVPSRTARRSPNGRPARPVRTGRESAARSFEPRTSSQPKEPHGRTPHRAHYHLPQPRSSGTPPRNRSTVCAMTTSGRTRRTYSWSTAGAQKKWCSRKNLVNHQFRRAERAGSPK